MERQKKPWSEMTEEEHQEIRESWKHTLPEEFDVFCIGDFTISSEDLIIPGNLYVHGVLETNGYDINVTGSLLVSFKLHSGNVTVGTNLIVNGNVDCCNVCVDGNFFADDDVDTFDITVNGDVIVNGEIDSTEISVDNLLDCYDVDSNFFGISVPDFVCRRYEAENK